MNKNKQHTPLEIFYLYLKDTLHASKSIPEKDLKEVFLKALRDYFDGDIDKGTLGVTASQILYSVKSPEEIVDDKFADALEAASEIDFYYGARNKNKNCNRIMYKSYAKKIKNYFEENKKILKNIPKVDKYLANLLK